MIRRPPRSTLSSSSAASDVYKRQIEKYRPATLEDVVSQDQIVGTLNKLVGENKMPHLLFYGPPGTGKTSTILAIARQIYGNNLPTMVLQLNASDDRGISVVRNQIKEFASTRMVFSSGHKLIVLDEADAMTNDAQMALRRVIEKYTKNVRFCIICNYVSKIIPALQSRCTRFRFSPLKPEQIVGRLEQIISEENCKVEDGALDALMTLGKGDMRRCVNILQSTSMAFPSVTEDSVYLCTGNPLPRDIESICQCLLADSYNTALDKIQQLKIDKGLALQDILTAVGAWIEKWDFAPEIKCFLYDELSTIEYRLAFGASERTQLHGLVGIFTQVKGMVHASA
eukprot:TRINITY_DN30771_c0_g1_i1.p1 TRINITY_DN30771_c0_g1~~TRINITY_DN30771_c0_g1_i1.p1  ORF type:complete len:341 (-),score=72.51 TRINITY_DN30771_c0_g1_i1:206-1228(-)